MRGHRARGKSSKLFIKWINPRRPIAHTGRGAILELLFGRGGGFAAALANYCEPVGIGNGAVDCGRVSCGRRNQPIHGVNSLGFLLLAFQAKKRTACRLDASHSFQYEGDVQFA